VTINSYLVGNEVQLNASFTNSSGALVDPTTITVQIQDPSGNLSSYAASKTSVGVYYYTYTPSLTGAYFYVFTGSGAVVAAAQGQFNVLPQSIV